MGAEKQPKKEKKAELREQTEKKGLLRALDGKRFAGNTNMIVLVVVVTAVAVLLNLLFELFPLNIDLTTEGLYTLTDTTEKVLDELTEDVTVYALYDRLEGEADTYRAQIIKVLDLYERNSHIDVEYVDLDRKPAFLGETVGAGNASMYSEGDYIVKCGTNTRQIKGDNMYQSQTVNYFYSVKTGLQVETKLTSAIIKVTSDVPVIYYSTAFGETSINFYSILTGYISDNGFDLKALDMKAEEIPEDAAAIMFFGPTEDLTGETEDKLDRWLENGGNAYFFMDVKRLSDDSYIYEKFEYFSELFSKYGIILGRSIVNESDDYAVSGAVTDSIFQTTTVTAGALEKFPNTTMYIRNTRTLDIDPMKEFAEPEAILQTSTGASAISIDDQESAVTGRQIIGASSRYTGGRAVGRIVVFGSSGTFDDTTLRYFGTATPENVMRYSMDWMELKSSYNVGDSIKAKRYNNYITSAITVSATQQRGIAIVSMFVIPGIVLVCGLVIWLRRRHL